jgi:hypothetical protein
MAFTVNHQEKGFKLMKVVVAVFCMLALLTSTGASQDNAVRVINERVIPLGYIPAENPDYAISDTAWQPNGDLLAIGFSFSNPTEIQLWDMESEVLRYALQVDGANELPHLAWNMEGEKLAAIFVDSPRPNDDHIFAWDITSPQPELIFSADYSEVFTFEVTVAWSRDSTRLITFHWAEVSEAVIWDVALQLQRQRIQLSRNNFSLSYSALHDLIAIGVQGGVSLYNSNLEEPTALLIDEPAWAEIHWSGWTADYQYLIGIHKYVSAPFGLMVIWNMEQKTAVPVDIDGVIHDQEIHPERNMIALLVSTRGDDGEFSNQIEFWTISDEPTRIGYLPAPNKPGAISWGHDDQLAIVTNDQRIVVWELAFD